MSTKVVNNTFRKYCQYQYRYFIRKVLPLLPPMLFLESIANTLTDTSANIITSYIN